MNNEKRTAIDYALSVTIFVFMLVLVALRVRDCREDRYVPTILAPEPPR